MTDPAMTTTPTDDEALVEQFARAMFDEWPLHAVSPALAEQSGQAVGAPLTYDKVLEMGGDHNGLLRLAKGAARLHAALTAAHPGGEDDLVRLLKRLAEEAPDPRPMSAAMRLAADRILALKAEIATLKQGSGISGP
jgi:hypothetical protein